MNRQGKTHECLEEGMEAANKAWWRDTKIYRSKDVSWRERCRRMGSENWSWSQKTFDRIKGWETKTMNRLFLQKRDKKKHGVIISQEIAGLPRKYG